jgi:hypothetical protein
MGRSTSVSLVLQAAQAGNAPGAVMDVSGLAYVGLQVVGAGFTGTVNFEVGIDGANWGALGMTPSTGAAVATTATATGMFGANVAYYAQLRARTSAVTGGSVTVTAYAESR